MSRTDPYSSATIAAAAAERVVKERSLSVLPIDPIALARDLGIMVMQKPARTQGVSGMLLRYGNTFGIAYATHIGSIGFQNFSVAHELGHYYLPGHIDAVLSNSDVHESHAGFASGDRYEIEADHFAATLLMPHALFTKAMSTAGDGLPAIESLAEQCCTSLTATAIRYARCAREPVAVVLSTGTRNLYCFMSDALKDVKEFNWIRKGEGLSNDTVTFTFNQNPDNIRRAERDEGTTDLQNWFGGGRSLSATEQVIGLGNYNRTLTVLTALDLEEQIEDLDEERELDESWTPRFRRR